MLRKPREGDERGGVFFLACVYVSYLGSSTGTGPSRSMPRPGSKTLAETSRTPQLIAAHLVTRSVWVKVTAAGIGFFNLDTETR